MGRGTVAGGRSPRIAGRRLRTRWPGSRRPSSSLGLVAFPILVRARRELAAFGASALGIAGLIATMGVGLYPNLVPALEMPERSMTIEQAASSDLTLTVMLVIALIGVPLVLAYTAFVYLRFRGKVRLDESGYGH